MNKNSLFMKKIEISSCQSSKATKVNRSSWSLKFSQAKNILSLSQMIDKSSVKAKMVELTAKVRVLTSSG